MDIYTFFARIMQGLLVIGSIAIILGVAYLIYLCWIYNPTATAITVAVIAVAYLIGLAKEYL